VFGFEYLALRVSVLEREIALETGITLEINDGKQEVGATSHLTYTRGGRDASTVCDRTNCITAPTSISSYHKFNP
jgi:hypothetical protein